MKDFNFIKEKNSELSTKWNEIVDLAFSSKTFAEKLANDILDAFGTDKLDFTDWAIESGFGCCVTYDGGNHPEFYANPFSNVYGLGRLVDGEIYFITEDCSECEVRDNLEFVSAIMEIASCVGSIEEWIEENETIPAF